MTEIAEIVDLGFVIADGENVKYEYDGDSLIFSFTDWKENSIKVRCENVIGFRYQWATYEYLEDERFDSCHIIHESEWLKLHMKQGETWQSAKWQHYKLNFNAAGVMEILCTKVEKI